MSKIQVLIVKQDALRGDRRQSGMGWRRRQVPSAAIRAIEILHETTSEVVIEESFSSPFPLH
jgi:hypothetical protein